MNADKASRLIAASIMAWMGLIAMPAFIQTGQAAPSPRLAAIKPVIAPETITTLMKWVVAKTGWAIQKPPTIRFVPSAQLAEMYYGKQNAPNLAPVRSLYAIKTHILYLPNTWNPGDLRDKGTLLHELAHHLQVLNRIQVVCVAEYDRQSYELQMAWLREHGVDDPYKFLKINPLTLFIMTQCPDY